MLDILKPSIPAGPPPTHGNDASSVEREDPIADTERLSNEIAELSAHIQVATYKPAVDLARRNWQHGLEIDSSTGFPRWQGERLHLNQAIDALRNALSDVSAETPIAPSRPNSMPKAVS